MFCFHPDDGAAVSPDLGDMSPEGPQPPMILLQQLLAAATQPSPVKAVFARQELEVPGPAALARPVCSPTDRFLPPFPGPVPRAIPDRLAPTQALRGQSRPWCSWLGTLPL